VFRSDFGIETLQRDCERSLSKAEATL
jgi:hypothetical protein